MVVNIDRGQVGTCRLKWKPGAIGIVNFENDFAVVPACLFEAIREQVKGFCFEIKDEIIHLIPDGGMIIKSGIFSGCEAVFGDRFSGNECVRVLVN